MESKVFNDVIHGHIEFHPLIVSIMDTPQFQRLRNIKQTGPCYFVYPGAVHTRFEHSLGTSFLAGKLMEALNKKRNAHDEERRRETLCVQIAGLCHDLGHGPFSHTWEKFLKRCDIKWKHEKMSVEIFDRILKETVTDKGTFRGETTIFELFRRYDMDGYINKIKNIILGDDSQDKENSYLYQIISNKTNGVDVDKWDYLMRDSKMINVPITFDCYRMIHCCQILETSPNTYEICFRDKDCATLIDMFLSRGLLHDKVYQHRKLKIIEEMLLDAFYLARNRLNLTSVVPDDFVKLTDHIYQKILYDDFGNDKNMVEAKKILEQISKRNLYVCIAAKEVKGGSVSESVLKKIEDEICENLKRDGWTVARNLIRGLQIDVHMTKYNRNELLRGVAVYTKPRQAEQLRAATFDMDKLHSLKPELKNLKRTEILILYKGNDRSKYYSYAYDNLLSTILEDITLE